MPLIAFVHCEKTAGSTLGGILREHFGDAFVSLGSRKNKAAAVEAMKTLHDGVQAVRGHIPLGVMQRRLPPETRYITILRGPLERTASHYFDLVQARATRDFDERTTRLLPSEGSSLVEALADRRVLPDNLQTRMLSSDPTAWKKWRRPLLPEALAEAKENLLNTLVAFGVTEHFDDSQRLILQTLRIPAATRYVNHRVNSARPKLNELDRESIEALRRHNELDLCLYSFARELFQGRLDDLRQIEERSTSEARGNGS